LLLFRIGPFDAEQLLGFVGSGFSKQDLEGMEDRHVIARLLNHGSPMPPFVFQTLPPTADDVESSIRHRIRARIEQNRQVYTKLVAEVDADARGEVAPGSDSAAQPTNNAN
jgi:hypothetical protein